MGTFRKLSLTRFFSERREFESRRNFSRNFYGFWIEDIQLSPFRIFCGFLDFLNFRQFQNKIVFSETIKLILKFKIHDIPASIAKRRIIKYVRKLVALWLFWFSTAWFSWFLFSWFWLLSSVAYKFGSSLGLVRVRFGLP